MKSPAFAILWELWRTSRKEMAMKVFPPMCFVAFLRGVVQGATPAEQLVIMGVFVLMLACVSTGTMLAWSQLDQHRTGFCFQLGFVRPVPTWKLVAIPMLYAATFSAICYIVPALFVRFILQSPFPVFRPALLIATAATCVIAGTWSPTTRLAKGIAMTVLVCGLVAWFASRSSGENTGPILMAMGRVDFYALSWQRILGCIGLILASIVVTTFAVGRQRQGERLAIESAVIHLWNRLRNPVATGSIGVKAPSSFANRVSAQCWYEARRFAPTVLMVAVAIAVLVFGFGYWQLEGVQYVWLLALGLSPIVFQFIGVDGVSGLRRKQGIVQLSKFDATRPVTNGQLTAVKILTVALTSLVAWMCVAAIAAIHISLFKGANGWREVSAIGAVVGNVARYWWVIGAFCVMLSYLCTTTVLLAVGLWIPVYPRSLYVLMAIIYAHFGAFLWDHHNGGIYLRPYLVPYGYLLAAVILAVSLYAIFKAVTSGCFSTRLFRGILIGWCIYVAVVVFAWSQTNPTVDIPSVVVVLGAVMLLVPLASAAMAPLALASHRHG